MGPSNTKGNPVGALVALLRVRLDRPATGAAPGLEPVLLSTPLSRRVLRVLLAIHPNGGTGQPGGSTQHTGTPGQREPGQRWSHAWMSAARLKKRVRGSGRDRRKSLRSDL